MRFLKKIRINMFISGNTEKANKNIYAWGIDKKNASDCELINLEPPVLKEVVKITNGMACWLYLNKEVKKGGSIDIDDLINFPSLPNIQKNEFIKTKQQVFNALNVEEKEINIHFAKRD